MKDKYTGVELDEVAGHSWIIDGYVIATLDDESHNVHVKDFYVHNNMGWDGANNGYNLLTALSSSPMAFISFPIHHAEGTAVIFVGFHVGYL